MSPAVDRPKPVKSAKEAINARAKSAPQTASKLIKSAKEAINNAARLRQASRQNAKSAAHLHHGSIQKSVESVRTSASALLKVAKSPDPVIPDDTSNSADPLAKTPAVAPKVKKSSNTDHNVPVVRTSLKLGQAPRAVKPPVVLPPHARMAQSAHPLMRSDDKENLDIVQAFEESLGAPARNNALEAAIRSARGLASGQPDTSATTLADALAAAAASTPADTPAPAKAPTSRLSIRKRPRASKQVEAPSALAAALAASHAAVDDFALDQPTLRPPHTHQVQPIVHPAVEESRRSQTSHFQPNTRRPATKSKIPISDVKGPQSIKVTSRPAETVAKPVSPKAAHKVTISAATPIAVSKSTSKPAPQASSKPAAGAPAGLASAIASAASSAIAAHQGEAVAVNIVSGPRPLRQAAKSLSRPPRTADVVSAQLGQPATHRFRSAPKDYLERRPKSIDIYGMIETPEPTTPPPRPAPRQKLPADQLGVVEDYHPPVRPPQDAAADAFEDAPRAAVQNTPRAATKPASQATPKSAPAAAPAPEVEPSFEPKVPDNNRYALGERSPFFLKTVNVEKRPLSEGPVRNARPTVDRLGTQPDFSAEPEPTRDKKRKNVYKKRKNKPAPRDLPTRPTVIIPNSRRSKLPLFFLILLTILLGAIVGAVAYLCFFQ